MNNDKTCRCCLEEQIPMISLYQCCTDIDDNMPLNEIIKSIAKIEVEIGDGLPDKICDLCVEELTRTFKFIIQLQDSDKALRSVEVLDISLTKPEEEYLEVKDEISNTDFTYNVKVEAMEVDDDKKLVHDSDKDSMDSFKLHLDDDEDDPPEVKSDIKLEPVEDSLMEREHDYSRAGDSISKPKLQKNISHNRTYTCNICDKQFKTKSGVKTHKQEEHIFAYKCKHCKKSFPEKMHLKVHMRAHLTEDKKPFVCTECDAQFAYEYQLTQHSYRHTKEKPFPCPKCDKGCITADSLKRHLRVHDKSYEKVKHVCPVCGKDFAYPSFLAEHMKNHTGERPFLCSFCGKSFRQRGALIYHVRTHQNVRPFQCEICKNTFVSQGILRVHMRRHTDERPYVCDICGRGFRQSSDCKMHRRIHLGLKLVECSVCKKKMSTTGQLTIHMRMHTGERPFSCPECYRRFSTRTMVAKHIRTHTGEKPYICSECGRPFSQSSSLSTHMKIHTRAREKENKEKENKEQVNKDKEMNEKEKPKKVVIVKLKTK